MSIAAWHSRYIRQSLSLAYPKLNTHSRNLSKNKRNVASVQQLAAAKYVAHEAPLPIRELVTLRDIIYLLNKTNRAVLKKSILQHYALPLRDLLLFIYDDRVRMNVRSEHVLKYMAKFEQENARYPTSLYDSVLTLLKDLDSRQLTGNAALDQIGSFVKKLEVEEALVRDDKIKQKPALQDVFFRCLDRNLRAGVNSLTLKDVFGQRAGLDKKTIKWPSELKHAVHNVLTTKMGTLSFSSERLDDDSNTVVEDSELEPSQQGLVAVPNISKEASSSETYGVALGKPTTLSELKTLFMGVELKSGAEEESTWYISRKLDGVRCIVRIDVDVSKGVQSPLQIVNVETMSRTERIFTSLDVLKQEIVTLLRTSPTILTILQQCQARRMATTSSPLSISSAPSPQIMSVYLDGELCALVPERDSQDGYKEDFAGIAGIVRRKSYTVPHPAYFPFDVLSEVEYRQWSSLEKNVEEHAPFYIRKKRVDEVADYCARKKSVIIRKLDQVKIDRFSHINQWVKDAALKGWEGLILRKGDLYKGKRTSSIRKFKHWQEAEYTVQSVEKAVMRLPVDQDYQDRDALASVTIKHNGVEVSVGSGFSVEERLRYGADPQLIIGKEITVQYFGESKSADRPIEEELSLRFPRVKKVWEEGNRDV